MAWSAEGNRESKVDSGLPRSASEEGACSVARDAIAKEPRESAWGPLFENVLIPSW